MIALRTRRLLGIAVVGVLLAAGTAWAAFEQEPGSPYPTGADPHAVYAADFNGDGRQDLAVANGTSSTINVYLRQAGGGFAQEAGSPVPVGSGPSYAVVGDFDGDARPDLAVALFVSGGVSVLLRQPGGGFAQEPPPTLPGRKSATGAGDFNGDGRLDLVVADWDGNQVTILFRNANNTGFTVGQAYATGNHPRQIAVADFNGDSLADIAIANADSANVTILLRIPGGGFIAEPPVAAGTGPAGIVAADFNRDGRPDLAVTNSGASSVSVLLRNATNNGFVQEGSPVAVGGTPVGITASDLDVDGYTDLAVATNAGGAAEVLRRNPGGGFTRDPTTAVTGAPNGIAAADFDRDGRPDLGVTSPGTNTLTILRNPAPAQPTPTPTPTPPPTPTPLPPPVAGRTVNATPVSGTVKVKLPGSKRYVDLADARLLPVGTSVDTRKGRVTLLAAGRGGKADFFDGLFKIAQTRGSRPLTTLTLIERLSCPRGARATVARKRKKSRKLWGDGNGRFRTEGRYSSATVRGTRWLVQDRCTSTLTRVPRGSVSVRDNVKRKTVILRAGRSYTARRAR